MAWLKRIEKPFLSRVTDLHELRRRFVRKARWYFHAPFGTERRAITLADRPALSVVRKGTTPKRHILYFHGGAYVFGAPATHAALLARLARVSEARAILPDYRKAPEHMFPAAIDDAQAAWAALIAMGVDPRDVVIGGDSAGGGIALGLLHQICVNRGPYPACVFALSPLTDLTFSGDSITQNAQSEAILPSNRVEEMAQMYLGDHQRDDPRASPLFGAFEGAPPVWLAVSETELLRDDTLRMAERLQAQGVDVTRHQTRDLPHVWPIFHNTLPEARSTLGELAGWIRQQTDH